MIVWYARPLFGTKAKKIISCGTRDSQHPMEVIHLSLQNLQDVIRGLQEIIRELLEVIR